MPFARESRPCVVVRLFLDAHEPTLPLLGFGRLLELEIKFVLDFTGIRRRRVALFALNPRKVLAYFACAEDPSDSDAMRGPALPQAAPSAHPHRRPSWHLTLPATIPRRRDFCTSLGGVSTGL